MTKEDEIIEVLKKSNLKGPLGINVGSKYVCIHSKYKDELDKIMEENFHVKHDASKDTSYRYYEILEEDAEYKFSKLGYNRVEDNENLSYYKNKAGIRFVKASKTIKMNVLDEKYISLDMETFDAIRQQLKELKW